MSNFQFRYPIDWTVNIEKENVVHILSGDGTDCRLNLYYSKKKVSLESELLRSINEFKLPMTDYKAIEQSVCKISGYEAIVIESEFVSKGDKLRSTQYIVNIGETTTIIITAIHNTKNIKTNAYMVKGIINSLKISTKKDSFNVSM